MSLQASSKALKNVEMVSPFAESHRRDQEEAVVNNRVSDNIASACLTVVAFHRLKPLIGHVAKV